MRLGIISSFNISASLILLVIQAYALEWSDLQSMSLEDLSQLEVSAADKIPTPLNQTAASIYVIDAQEIRRSGASTLYEVLQLAPNLHIGRQDANQSIVSTRGFFEDLSNKLQVLIDGRILYTPLYSTVNWDAQDLLVNDIKQVEIISGPADVSWGANAMNGVINIVTKAADKTASLVDISAGTMQSHAAVRVSRQTSPDSAFRVYGKSVTSEGSELDNEMPAGDDWTRHQAGFRYDKQTLTDSFQLQGGAYQADINSDQVPLNMDGAHVLGSFTEKQQLGQLHLLGYIDYFNRDYENYFEESVTSTYIEARYLLNKYGSHALLLGADYRYAKDNTENLQSYGYIPEDESLRWFSTYIQDHISLTETLDLKLGIRLEDNSYTGLETMPTLRMIWNYQRNQSYWFALSRNVRTPSRSDRDLVFPNNPPYYVIADNDFQSETAQTLQLGWKALIQDNTYLNFTVFYTSYKKLHAAILEDTQYTLVNGLDANTHGVEFWGSMQLLDQWKVKAGATFVDEDFKYRENAGPFLNMNENAPVTQFSVQSQYDLTPSLELDFYYRYVGQLAYSDVPSSDFLDVRLAWWPVSDIELSIKGTNLLSSHQIEYRAIGQNDHYFERNFKLGIRWYP